MPLEWLNCSNNRITDVEPLRGIPLTGSGMAHLRNKNNLTALRLPETGIENAAVQPLRGLKNLTRLDLQQTQITDAAIDALGTLSGLKALDIGHTGITEDGAKRLVKALPRCKITR